MDPMPDLVRERDALRRHGMAHIESDDPALVAVTAIGAEIPRHDAEAHVFGNL